MSTSDPQWAKDTVAVMPVNLPRALMLPVQKEAKLDSFDTGGIAVQRFFPK